MLWCRLHLFRPKYLTQWMPCSKPYHCLTWLLPSEPTATRGQTLSPEGPTRHPPMSWLFTSTGITSGRERIILREMLEFEIGNTSCLTDKPPQQYRYKYKCRYIYTNTNADVVIANTSCLTVDHLTDGPELGGCCGNCQKGAHLFQVDIVELPNWVTYWPPIKPGWEPTCLARSAVCQGVILGPGWDQ